MSKETWMQMQAQITDTNAHKAMISSHAHLPSFIQDAAIVVDVDIQKPMLVSSTIILDYQQVVL